MILTPFALMLPLALGVQEPAATDDAAPDPAALEEERMRRLAERYAAHLAEEGPPPARAAQSDEPRTVVRAAVELAEQDRWLAAEQLVDRALEAAAETPVSDRELAVLRLTRGALRSELAERWSEVDPGDEDGALDVELALQRERLAEGDLAAALELSGSGEVGARAAYDLGALRCRAAERLFRAGVSQAMLQGPAPDPSQGAPSFPPDSPQRQLLEASADGFRAARAVLAERLRLDATHDDTRANLEWAQRRLREIERALREEPEQEPPPEEQQQHDEQQPQEQEQQESEDSQESSGEGEPQQEPSEEPQEQQPSEEPSAEQESAPEEQPGEEEGEGQQDEQAPGEEEGENQTEPQGDAEQEAAQDEQAQEQPSAEPTVELSDEEIARLLDRLQQIEAAREELERRLARIRRVPVERDW